MSEDEKVMLRHVACLIHELRLYSTFDETLGLAEAEGTLVYREQVMDTAVMNGLLDSFEGFVGSLQ